jgi:hypothetical protein
VHRRNAPLQPLRSGVPEVIVVDAGSRDATIALAIPLADRILSVPRGRAVRMRIRIRTASFQERQT